jgi:hypothetical protein
MAFFTPSQAFSAHRTTRPIMVTEAQASKMVKEHAVDYIEFLEEVGQRKEYDAWAILSFLGY